jgi:hypothetical protein
MDAAIDQAAQHVGPNGIVEVTRGGNVQFRSTEIDANGQTINRMGRFDVNPGDPHVMRDGPHLNIETHINGVGPNIHISIDPSTIRPGDYGGPP